MEIMIKKIIILAFLVLSCKRNNSSEFFYPKGELKIKTSLNDKGQLHGSYEEFYKTGQLKLKTSYENGMLHDTVFHYHKNGKIKEKGVNKNGDKIGWWTSYDTLGLIIRRREYLVVGDSLYKNQDIHYNKNGTVKNENSTYFEIEIQDTINHGKNLGKLNLYKSNFSGDEHLISVVIENQYSEQLKKKDTFGDNSMTPLFGIYGFKEGDQTVKGTIIETILNSTSIGKDSSSLRIRKHKKYFEKEVYVKDSIQP